MIKYLSDSSVTYKIKIVEVVKETEKSVWTAFGDRKAKRSCSSSFFDTFEEAKAFLIERAEYNVKAKSHELKKAESRLASLLELKDER